MKKIILAICLALGSVACGGGDGGDDGVEIPDGGGSDGDGDVVDMPDGEFDCDAAAVVQPLPIGTYPLVLAGVWDCEYSDGDRTIETINSDGTFSLSVINGSIPSWITEQWNECRVGTKPPAIAGHWVISSVSGNICSRWDSVPYIVECGPYRINQSGELVTSASDLIKIYEDGIIVPKEVRERTISSVCVKR